KRLSQRWVMGYARLSQLLNLNQNDSRRNHRGDAGGLQNAKRLLIAAVFANNPVAFLHVSQTRHSPLSPALSLFVRRICRPFCSMLKREYEGLGHDPSPRTPLDKKPR